MPNGQRKKIAILGGGPAGLMAAFRLTEAAPDAFDITVYQMGWRLGGKGTSGYRRWTPPGGSAPIWNRIEEHGLHILFGFYETVFATMRACYDEIGRPPGHPLARFEDAFEPRDFGTAMFRFRSRWHAKNVWFHRNDAAPGVGDTVDSGDVIEALSSAFANLLGDVLFPVGNPNEAIPADAPLRKVVNAIGSIAMEVFDAIRGPIAAHPEHALRLLRFWQRWTRGPLLRAAQVHSSAYLIWLAFDFFAGLAVGMLEAGLVDGGVSDDDFEALDHLDYRQWLLDNGLHRDTAASPFVSMIYHAGFSYEGGDPQRPAVAAGSALRVIFRAMTEYRGSAYYKMRGGMGEIVFVPFYQALRARGVRFELFHRVEALHLDAAKTAVAAIDFTRQARLANDVSAYEPLITVNGVEAFPSEPLYDQLDTGEALQHVRFESYYQREFPTGEAVTLERGTGFDHVVLATPVATLPYVAEELLADSQRWRDQVEHVKSVQTVSLQVWFDASHAELGWEQPDRDDPHTLLSTYWKPMSTWVPMDQTLPREQWPPGMEPRAVSYFTGTQPGPETAPDPRAPDTGDFVGEQQKIARTLSEDFFRNFVAEDLLPKLEDDISPPLPRFEMLHDPEGRTGSARFEAQLARCNCEPSERCTLALPGATQHRMRAGDTGYDNLVVAGDWIQNGIGLACMEGAFTGGRLAAEAVLERTGEGE